MSLAAGSALGDDAPVSFIREKIASIGLFLLLAGVISGVLQLIGFELRIFRALNEQPPLVAWGVRGGAIAVGAVLMLLGPKSPEAQPEAPAPTPQSLGQDPRVQWLLAWAYQQLGATLTPQPGGARIAHVAFWNAQSLPVTAADPGVAKTILYVDNFRQARWVVIGDLSTRNPEVHPCPPDAWAYNVPS